MIVAALTVVVGGAVLPCRAFGRRSIEYGTLRLANFSLETL
ncbi:hypothetical protein [Haladaptatus sp. R4]|nr:hypothetical protein [Haladaptatus sp. R4]